MTTKMLIWTVILCTLLLAEYAHAFGVQEPVSKLLQTYQSDIGTLKQETESILGKDAMNQIPYNNDIFYLRYCLDNKGVDELQSTLAWRQGDGQALCQAAVQAYQEATADGAAWKNDPVREAAPAASLINPYINPSTSLTTPGSNGDLLYIIRAGKIDDKSLMSSLESVDQMVDFFIYCKEINSLVLNERSMAKDKLLYLVTINDLNGLQLVGGDKSFRQALSDSSKQAALLYPGLNGPSLLFNLPRLVTALAKLFTPLFPPEVQARIKFERGPLAEVDELMNVSPGGKDRDEFLNQVDEICQ